jgi:hypothetical protein
MAPPKRKAQRRPAEDEPLVAQLGRYDYADSFEIRLDEPETRPPVEWMRAAIGDAPVAIRTTVGIAWRYLLRFDLHPHAPGHLFGMPVIESTPELAHGRGDSPVLVGHLIGRRVEPTLITLTTVLVYKRPVLAVPVWTIAGPAHRRIAPDMLERVANPVS